jgi:tRNA-guanine family transglycosylase
MGRLVIFCAGTDIGILPAKKVTSILVNPFDNAMNQKAIRETLAMFAYAGTENRFLDSGGYQIYKAEEQRKAMTFDPNSPLINSDDRINISPTHVIETARQLKPDMMTALDFPIRTLNDKAEREQEFLRKLGFNIKWAIEASSLRGRHCSQVQLFLPVQCYDLDQFDFFKRSIGGISYDALSMPLRNLELDEIALFLLRFHQLGARKVHLLGSTSFFVIALSAFFARQFFEWVSLDATSWRLAAEKAQAYFNPFDLSTENMGDNVLIDESIPMICQCPFCENTTFTYIKTLPYTDKLALLRSHNFWVIEQAAEDLYKNASDLLRLEKFLKCRSPRVRDIDNLIRCLSIIDIYKKEDINVLKQLLRIDT